MVRRLTGECERPRSARDVNMEPQLLPQPNCASARSLSLWCSHLRFECATHSSRSLITMLLLRHGLSVQPTNDVKFLVQITNDVKFLVQLPDILTILSIKCLQTCVTCSPVMNRFLLRGHKFLSITIFLHSLTTVLDW